MFSAGGRTASEREYFYRVKRQIQVLLLFGFVLPLVGVFPRFLVGKAGLNLLVCSYFCIDRAEREVARGRQPPVVDVSPCIISIGARRKEKGG